MFKGRTSARYCPSCRKKRTNELVKVSQLKNNPYMKIGAGSGNVQWGSSNHMWIEDRTKSSLKYISYKNNCYKYYKKRCVICGSVENIAVHHIDSDKKNNNPTNLIPLCKYHHLMMHKRIKPSKDEMVRRLFSVWGEGQSKIAELSEKLSKQTTRTEGCEEIAQSGATTRSEETIISHEAATPVCQIGEKIV